MTLVDVDGWARWWDSPRGRAQWRRWRSAHPELRGWTDAEVRSPSWSTPVDAMQAALVRLAQAGEGEAALTIAVQLRPGLVRLATRAAATQAVAWDDAAQEVRAVFFETLCRHRLHRRPHKIAANLILDTRQRLIRGRALPDRGSSPWPELGHRPGPAHGLRSDLEVVATLRSTIEALPGSDSSKRLTAAVAYRAWILDEPLNDIARDLGIGRETVTTRLHRLRSALRPALAA